MQVDHQPVFNTHSRLTSVPTWVLMAVALSASAASGMAEGACMMQAPHQVYLRLSPSQRQTADKWLTQLADAARQLQGQPVAQLTCSPCPYGQTQVRARLQKPHAPQWSSQMDQHSYQLIDLPPPTA